MANEFENEVVNVEAVAETETEPEESNIVAISEDETLDEIDVEDSENPEVISKGFGGLATFVFIGGIAAGAAVVKFAWKKAKEIKEPDMGLIESIKTRHNMRKAYKEFRNVAPASMIATELEKLVTTYSEGIQKMEDYTE